MFLSLADKSSEVLSIPLIIQRTTNYWVIDLAVKAHVVEVIDGDTFKTKNIIRLEGVDAPELDEEGGKEAKQELENLILDKDITYEEKARDEHARIIAQVWVDSLSVNDAMNRFLGK